MADERLPLEIARAGRTRYLVLWQGKPLADAEVVIAKPGKEQPETMKSDKDGGFDLIAETPGTYGIRARHIEKKEGEHDGKKYTEVRHYTTLVVKATSKEDPAASKLLADARAARALWKEFPGFSADIEINLDGKISKGTVTVDSNGKAKYEGLSKEAEAWAKPIFGSIVGHRLDGTPRNTPCAFVDEEVNHPMGRRIRVLNDELHSGYRIKDDQILVVDRHVESRKFTISVLENRKNAEGKYLPVSFVVDYWNPHERRAAAQRCHLPELDARRQLRPARDGTHRHGGKTRREAGENRGKVRDGRHVEGSARDAGPDAVESQAREVSRSCEYQRNRKHEAASGSVGRRYSWTRPRMIRCRRRISR